MKKKYLTVPFEMKQTQEDEDYFFFEGYASTFGNVDLGDDIVERGAFSKTLSERTPKLLWQHQMNEPVGVFTEAFEDEKGLFVRGKMPKADTFVKGRVMPQMKIGSVDSMSIGFSIIRDEWDREKDIRYIKEVFLYEASLVTIPMNPKAVVTGVKTVVPFQDLSLADRDRAWDGAAAVKRVKDFTNSTEAPSRTYRRAFLWYDSENKDLFGSYKLPVADVVDGKLKAVPRAIFAAAAAMRGARGGVDIPDADRDGVINNIDKYYAKMDLESPFEKSIEEEIQELKTLKDVNNYFKDYGIFSNNQIESLIAKMKEILKQGNPEDQGKPGENLKSLLENNIIGIKKITQQIKGE